MINLIIYTFSFLIILSTITVSLICYTTYKLNLQLKKIENITKSNVPEYNTEEWL